MKVSHLTPIEDAQYDEIEDLLKEQKDNLNEEEHYEIQLSLLNLEFDQFPKIIEFLKSKRL